MKVCFACGESHNGEDVICDACKAMAMQKPEPEKNEGSSWRGVIDSIIEIINVFVAIFLS